MNKERNSEDKSLKVAAENADCMSHRLRDKAQALRNLSTHAKTWESDLKRASENLKVKIDTQARAKTPVIQLSPAPGYFIKCFYGSHWVLIIAGAEIENSSIRNLKLENPEIRNRLN